MGAPCTCRFIHLVGQIFENQLHGDHGYPLTIRLYMMSIILSQFNSL